MVDIGWVTPDPQDQVEFSWAPEGVSGRPDGEQRVHTGRRWLSVWFRCCHAYGRLYRNPEGTMYLGHCPRCGATVRALIGPGGTTRRLFETT